MTMTIEIKQLIIRAVVEGRRERSAGTEGARNRVMSAPVHHTAPAAPRDIALDRETLIVECARQVLRELQRGRGR